MVIDLQNSFIFSIADEEDAERVSGPLKFTQQSGKGNKTRTWWDPGGLFSCPTCPTPAQLGELGSHEEPREGRSPSRCGSLVEAALSRKGAFS